MVEKKIREVRKGNWLGLRNEPSWGSIWRTEASFELLDHCDPRDLQCPPRLWAELCLVKDHGTLGTRWVRLMHMGISFPICPMARGAVSAPRGP